MGRLQFRKGAQLLILVAFTFSSTAAGFVARASAHGQGEHTPPVHQKLTWTPCVDPIEQLPSERQECATLKVPLDYKKPHGKKISVAISRVKAASAQLKRGVLFMNPGGPGGPGLDLPQIFAQIMPQEVLDRYDLIGFDPRGVGQSTPISCGLNMQEYVQAFPPLTQAGSFEATAAFTKKIAKKCQQTSGNLLPHITTANTVRDMEQMRKALGVSKISYLGYSYGTHLGAVYSTKFPNKTDRFILDSSTSPEWAWRDQFRSWRLAETDRFPDFAKFLVDNKLEYNLGNSEAEVNALFMQLVKKLQDNPVILEDGTPFNGELFRRINFGGLYTDAYFPEIAYIWQMAKDIPTALDKTALRKQISQLDPLTKSARSHKTVEVALDNNAAVGFAVLCGDATWSRSPAQYKTELMADTMMSPKLGAIGSNIWPCAFWTDNHKEAPTTISDKGARNILIVQNMRDPATPYIGAQQMRTKLGQRAQMVSVNEGGHGVAFSHPNMCATKSVVDYLVSGSLPADDAICDTEVAVDPNLRTATATTKAKAIDFLRQAIR